MQRVFFENGVYVGDSNQNGFAIKAVSNGPAKELHSMESSYRPVFKTTYSSPITMPAPAATVYGNGTNSHDGYIELSWDAEPNATGYYVGIFNGEEYQVIAVDNATSWSTQGKKIWPTEAQISAGEYRLRVDENGDPIGDGDELHIFPNMAYRNAPDGPEDYDNDTNYYFIIIPHNLDGYMTYPTYCTPAPKKLPDVIEPSTPSSLTITPSSWSTDASHTIEWTGIQDYNGTDFVTTNIGTIEYAIETGAITTVSGSAVWNNTGEVNDNGSYTIDTSSLADGTYTIFQRTVDKATPANISDTAYVNIKIDRTAPTIGGGDFISDAINWTNTNTVTFTYDTISDAASGVNTAEIFQGLSKIDDVDTALTSYNMDVTAITYEENVYTLKVVDNTGNEFTANTYVRIDKQAPQVSISSPIDGSKVNGIVEIWGTCTDGQYTSMDSYLVEVLR